MNSGPKWILILFAPAGANSARLWYFVYSLKPARCVMQRAGLRYPGRYASSPSGMMQVMRVRFEQAFQEDQGQPSEATGPGVMYTGLPVAR